MKTLNIGSVKNQRSFIIHVERYTVKRYCHQNYNPLFDSIRGHLLTVIGCNRVWNNPVDSFSGRLAMFDFITAMLRVVPVEDSQHIATCYYQNNFQYIYYVITQYIRHSIADQLLLIWQFIEQALGCEAWVGPKLSHMMRPMLRRSCIGVQEL